MTAVAACLTCGTELLDNARFCHGCGAAVAEPDARAEYKQVTVLFADVVGSMDIAAAVGAERLREIMAELADRCAAVVQRLGGTVDKFTGDGVMAVFGAPVALEDHAIRACLAALGIQEEVRRLANDVEDRDGIALRLRVGLNSGQVIAGEIGSGPFGYTAVGEQVGMAQRMESVAPPGGVMLSESTAQLVEEVASLGDVETVCIKGSKDSGKDRVPAHRLLSVAVQGDWPHRPETALVGRQWELNTVTAVLDRAIEGRGCVVGVAGPAGIGKSRLVREAAAIARDREITVFSTFCESHTTDVPFHVVARLLRGATRIADLDDDSARALLREQFADAGDEDLQLLHDLLGISDPTATSPTISPDARRRRLTALINSMSLANSMPALYVIEDAHWIDSASESLFVDLMSVIPQTHSVVLLTYRHEYRGELAQLPGAQTISLAPLSNSEISTLLANLLGPDASVATVLELIARRAVGNPFFAQEMVRELAERGVLEGGRGQYTCRADVADISVPATLQTAIAARIDRLEPAAKQAINAASVIGLRFTPDLLSALGIDLVPDELVRAELIDQVRFTPYPEYAFRHPLIRTVAYESQLKSARAQLHHRLAITIEVTDRGAADENAALIAEHLEAAGDLHAAFGWHMRAAGWSINRDIAAARISWERAVRVADSLPVDDADRLAMRIAPRTTLCATGWRGRPEPASARFEDLRKLCAEAGDEASLAIAMSGLISDHVFRARMPEASQLMSEQMALVESRGDPGLAVAAAFPTIAVEGQLGHMTDVLRWSQAAVEWADGDSSKSSVSFGSLLAVALVLRSSALWWFGRPGWREDLDQALAIARVSDPTTRAFVLSWGYGIGLLHGVLRVDDTMMADFEKAVSVADASSDDNVLGSVKYTLGTALLQRAGAQGDQRGIALLVQVREMCVSHRFPMTELPVVEMYLARDETRRGDYSAAIWEMHRCLDLLYLREQITYVVGATALLVEALVGRGADSDLDQADAALERLVGLPGYEDCAARDIMALRVRTMLADARGDSAYRELRDRYRAMANSLGFEGHMAWADAMP